MIRSGARGRTFAAVCAAGALLACAMVGAPASAGQKQLAQQVGQEPVSGDRDGRGSWRLSVAGDEQLLTWRSPVKLPVTDARPEFRAEGVLLGYPQLSADRRTLTLAVEDVDVDRVAVWLSGQRLDVSAATGPESRLGPAEPTPVGPTVVPAVDPGQPGALTPTSFDYTAADLPWREFEADLEVVGHVVLPEDAVNAPVVLFLHGRHQACYGDGDTGSWPCAGDSQPVPSHLGYDYLQQLLASQGYATVSIAANGINGQDWRSLDGGASARSALVRHHLALLAQWTADAGRPRWFGRLDMERTMLVGHSRGGEGVNQAAIETLADAPYRLIGQTLIAPTDFGFQTAGYLPTVTLLPYCDGDVFDLQGQRFVEAAASLGQRDPSLRSSVLMRGANHNFFNTEWTPRISEAPSFDDWGAKDHRLCGSEASETRLTAAEQRRAARTFIGASVAAFANGDQAAVDIVDSGLPVRIPAAGDAVAWTHAIGGNRRTVRVDAGALPQGNGTRCRAVTAGMIGVPERAAAGCAPGARYARPLHWTFAPPVFASVQAASLAAGAPVHLRLRWTAPGGVGGLTVGRPLNLSDPGSTLDLRIVADPEAPRARFAVRLGDGDGTMWDSPVVALSPHPGSPDLVALHARTVRVSTDGAPPELDLSAVTSIELVQQSTAGSLWVLDASARRLGLAPVPDIQLPSVSLGRLRIEEGDSPAQRIALVPFTLHGDVLEPGSFGVSISQFSFGDTAPAVSTVVEISPGDTSGFVEVPFRADNRHGRPLVVQPIAGTGLDDVTMRTYLGRLSVEEDDPFPSIALRAPVRHVNYGEPLRFVVELSQPLAVENFVGLRAVAGPADRQLLTDNVPRRWLTDMVGEFELGRPLATYLRRVRVFFEPGQRRAVFEVPTVARQRAQPVRVLGMRLVSGDEPATVSVTVH